MIKLNDLKKLKDNLSIIKEKIKTENDEFFREFKNKKYWWLFLQDHGTRSSFFEETFPEGGIKDGDQQYTLDFKSENTCRIIILDYFRGELVREFYSDVISFSEFEDFINTSDEEYYKIHNKSKFEE